MKTVRANIIDEIVTELSDITIENGYNTDMGQYVFRSLKKVDLNKDVPCIVVSAGQETVSKREFGSVFCSMPIEIEGIDKPESLEAASDLVETMLGDILKVASGYKMSALAKEVTYSKGGAAGYPDPGERVVAVQVSLIVNYSFKIGDPYNS